MSFEVLIIEAIAIFILILLNGFFSSSEISIISARRSVIDKLAKDGNASAEAVARMKADPDRFLATVQIGVTVVSTLASVIGGIIAVEYIERYLKTIPIDAVSEASGVLSVIIIVAVLSYATLIIGELVPKTLALKYPEKIACLVARPLMTLSGISSFFVSVLTASNRAILTLFGVKDLKQRVFISEEEVKFYIAEGRATGVFEETEAALLHGIFEFADTTVKEVMIPKHKFTAIEINTPSAEILKFISETGFSRYPVYEKSYEKVVGVLFNKDVFRTVERGSPLDISKLLRAAYFVPNTIMISRLLREMQRQKVHMAIVIDEHGDVDGLVTIEDILEEIVGEIEDEYDIGKGGLIEKLRDGTMIIDASASLRDLEDLGIVIDSEDEEYHTLAGFMLAKLQRIPRGGEFVVYKDLRLTVVDVELNRIVRIKVEPVAEAKKTAAQMKQE